MTLQTKPISSPFLWRRIHSLMGLWLVLYLCVHLLTNSQAALWVGEDGIGFIRLVNSLESLPYLRVIEIVFIAIPLLVHLVWGVKRALTAKTNAYGQSKNAPSLPYERNKAFTWQRLTSWILLFGILGHVVQMRFLAQPKEASLNNQKQYIQKVTFDEGLYTLGPRLGVTFYSAKEIAQLKQKEQEPVEALPSVSLEEGIEPKVYAAEKEATLSSLQLQEETQRWIQTLDSFSLTEYQVLASCPAPGTAILLMVRDTFKSPWMVGFYTLFVLAAVFHAFNGFWTALITWGILLSSRSQKAFLPLSYLGMALLAFLGLAAIWGSYWINLRT